MSPKFNTAAETLEQRQARLEAYKDALEESLRTPPQQRMKLTPQGQLYHDSQELARQATEHKRAEINDELDRIGNILEARESRTLTKNRNREL